MPAVDSAQTRRVAPIGIAPRGSVRARISRRSQPSILPAAAHRLANRVIGTPYTLYELRRSVIPIAFAIACRTTSASPASTIQPDHTVKCDGRIGRTRSHDGRRPARGLEPRHRPEARHEYLYTHSARNIQHAGYCYYFMFFLMLQQARAARPC